MARPGGAMAPQKNLAPSWLPLFGKGLAPRGGQVEPWPGGAIVLQIRFTELTK